MSRARSWPTWWLNFVLARPWMGHLHAEAWIEWHRRAVEEAEESGAFQVASPKGKH